MCRYFTATNPPATTITGLKRRDFCAERLAVVRQMHKLIFRSGLTLEQAVAEVEGLRGQGGDQDLQLMLDFLASSRRGLVR